MNKISQNGLVLFFFLSQSVFAFGSELFSSADLMENGSWNLSVYGRTSEMEPVFESKDKSAIQVPNSSGGAVFSQSDSEVKVTQSLNSVNAALTFRPGEGMQYRVRVGQVRDFELEFASGSSTNELEGLLNGITWGLGARLNLTQATLVSAAIALDFSYGHTAIKLDKFQGGSAAPLASDFRFEQDEFQAALNASYRWRQFDPFAGIKLARVRTQLKDSSTKAKISGTTDFYSPYVGLKWEFMKGESVLVEASFVDEKSLSAGVNLTF